MAQVNSLNEVVELNKGFKTAINLYLNINKSEKILNYIPTKSSLLFLKEYLGAVKNNKEQATLLVGPYGKGKSHFLLVLLAILSIKPNGESEDVIKKLVEKFDKTGEIENEVIELIGHFQKNKKPFLPVIINGGQGDLNQAFLHSLDEALKREKLNDLVPDTYYSFAIKRIEEWKNDFPNTYIEFERHLLEYSKTGKELKADLRCFSKKALDLFQMIYPKVTSGSEFNPFAVSDVLPLYKEVSEKLVDGYGYSGIYIVFDEFSKFIESQEGTATGNNMKLLQDICELAMESTNTQVFITMVAHKSIKEYGKYLSADTINSFTGIEGRIVEKYFITSSKNNYELIKNAIIKKIEDLSCIPKSDIYIGEEAFYKFYQVPVFRSNFEREDFKNIILKGCYPLNPISAYLLLNISEKVAQNERTLFTFISNDEPHSMARFIYDHVAEMLWGVGADLIYDYFSGLFKKEIINELVHNEWLNAEYALSKCETEEQRRIIKTLALFLIVNKEEELPANEKFLANAVYLSEGSEVFEKLLKKELIYKKGSTGYFAFKTRAGSALKSEIKKQRDIKGVSVNIGKVLQVVLGKAFYFPRKYNTERMMTRYFRHEFLNVDDFLEIKDASVFFDENETADGKVISLYSLHSINSEIVLEHVQELKCKKLVVVCPKQNFKLIKQARDFEILQELKGNTTFLSNNEVLKKELFIMEEDLLKELGEFILNEYEDSIDTKVYFYNGSEVESFKANQVEKAVNYCCEEVYYLTPIINNEMINRRNINTGATKKARYNIVHAILTHNDNEKFYKGTNQEATIYRSLLCRTGIKNGIPSKEMENILEKINKYVESCADKKTSILKLIKELTTEPYGIRNGVIPVYLAYVLANRKEDLVVYFSDLEVQISADIIINMCEKPEDYALFVSKEDLEKEKYISSLNELFHVEEQVNLSENRIKNIVICMQRWFRALPQVTRNASNLENYKIFESRKRQMIKLKHILQNVDINSYEILFVKFPTIFETKDNLEDTYKVLDEIKTAYDDYYDWVLNTTLHAVKEMFGNSKNMDLYHMLKNWYDNQSELSKRGLHSGRITNFMTTLEKLSVYDNYEVLRKVVKAISNVYIENWNDSSYEEFIRNLTVLKKEIEEIQEEETDGKLKLEFIGQSGKRIEKFYERVDESSGNVFRNVIEDALEDFEDLSVNDRVAILLEMIEKIIG